MIEQILKITGFIIIIGLLLSIIDYTFRYFFNTFLNSLSFCWRVGYIAHIYKKGFKQKSFRFKDNKGKIYEIKEIKGKKKLN